MSKTGRKFKYKTRSLRSARIEQVKEVWLDKRMECPTCGGCGVKYSPYDANCKDASRHLPRF